MNIYYANLGNLEMKLINDKNNPDLLAILETKDEFVSISKMVEGMNQDLIDSGFDRYKFKAELRGNKAYIRRI